MVAGTLKSLSRGGELHLRQVHTLCWRTVLVVDIEFAKCRTQTTPDLVHGLRETSRQRRCHPQNAVRLRRNDGLAERAMIERPHGLIRGFQQVR